MYFTEYLDPLITRLTQIRFVLEGPSLLALSDLSAYHLRMALKQMDDPRRTGRTVDICLACAKEKEIVSRGICAACYMALRREMEQTHSTPTAQRKTLLRQQRSWSKIRCVMIENNIPEIDQQIIEGIFARSFKELQRAGHIGQRGETTS